MSGSLRSTRLLDLRSTFNKVRRILCSRCQSGCQCHSRSTGQCSVAVLSVFSVTSRSHVSCRISVSYPSVTCACTCMFQHISRQQHAKKRGELSTCVGRQHAHSTWDRCTLSTSHVARRRRACWRRSHASWPGSTWQPGSSTVFAPQQAQLCELSSKTPR